MAQDLRDIDRPLTIRDAACTIHVSESWIRNAIKSGELPAQRLGKRLIRIDAKDLFALMQKTNPEKAEA